jgi:hypothetical protein
MRWNMGDVVDIEGFKARKLKRLEDEWAMYVDRAAVLKKEGKHKFAEEMLTKAKATRKEIDKLRKPKKEPVREVPLIRMPTMPVSLTYTFEGLSSADMGHRREMTPEPENN